MKNPQSTPLIALLMVPLLWGWGYPLTRAGMETIGPLGFLFWRFAIPTVIIGLMMKNDVFDSYRSDWMHGVKIGVALFFAYAFLNLGLAYTTTARAGFIIGFRVVLVPSLGVILFNSRSHWSVWMAAVLSVIGLIFIFLTDNSAGAVPINRGDIIMLGSAAAFALHVVLISHYSIVRGKILFLFLQLAVVCLFGGIGMLLFEQSYIPQTWPVWKNIVLTGLFSTGLAYLIQNHFQRFTTPDKTGIVFSTEPLFAAFFGYIYLQEQLYGLQWLGAAFIVAAIFMAQPTMIKRLTGQIRRGLWPD